MIQTQRIAVVAQAAGITHEQAEAALHALYGTFAADLRAGERVRLPGIGTLVVKATPGRTNIRNPQTGENLPDLPPGRKIKFSPALAMKELLFNASPKAAE